MVRSKKEVQEMVEKEIASLEDAILASKTVVELKKIAKERGISLKGITKKADILKALGVSSPKAKAKSKKAPAKSKAKKTTAGEGDLFKQAKEALKVRNTFIKAFKAKYKKELEILPKSATLSDIAWYLSGTKLRILGINHQLPEPIISGEFRDVITDLISSNEDPGY